MKSILLVDDHDIFRDGLIALLDGIDGYNVIADVSDGKQALEKIDLLKPDLVITDLHMPVMDGIALSQSIKNQHPAIKILILTMIDESTQIELCRTMGVDGYISKTTNLKGLKKVLSALFDDDATFQLVVSENTSSLTFRKSTSAFEQLTKREREILHHIAQGLTDKDIAQTIHLSPYTVITHRRNLLSKLGLNNKVELTRFAISHGLS